MSHENPEPLSDDPEEAENLRRIEALNTLPDFARYLMSRGVNEFDAADFVLSFALAIRREL